MVRPSNPVGGRWLDFERAEQRHVLGAPAKLFHWLISVLVFLQFRFGWWAVSLRLSPLKINLFVWHKSIGMVVLVLVILRLVWRLTNTWPSWPR